MVREILTSFLLYFLMSFATSTPGGRITASIAWITPFDAMTSAATTVAWLTMTPPIVESFTFWPSTVATSPSVTSAAMTMPDTTW